MEGNPLVKFKRGEMGEESELFGLLWTGGDKNLFREQNNQLMQLLFIYQMQCKKALQAQSDDPMVLLRIRE